MKVNMDEQVLDNRRRPATRVTGELERDPESGRLVLDGNGLPMPVREPMTIGDLIIDVLNDRDTDPSEGPKEKLRRARLSDQILDGGMIELTARDVTLILTRAGGPGVPSTAYLRIVEVLGDPDEESKPAPEADDPDGQSDA